MQLTDEERAARDKELEELERARKVQAEVDKSRAAAMENLRLPHYSRDALIVL